MINVLKFTLPGTITTLPTRMNRTLDLFITSHPSLIERCSTGPSFGLSYQDCLFVSFKLQADINKKTGANSV